MRKSVRNLLTITVIIFVIFLAEYCNAQTSGRFQVQNGDRLEDVTYIYNIPDSSSNSHLPLMIYVGGLSSPGIEFMWPYWKDFATKNNFAQLAVGFKFIDEDWKKNKSYQYPKVWSGEALMRILEILSRTDRVNTKELYLVGISAGAQFVHRFALIHPEICAAVAAHAAGGYDHPSKRIPTKFLITVGDLDNDKISRLEFAKLFVAACKKQGIDVEFKIMPGLGHRQTDDQNNLTQEFFLKVKSNR